MAQSIFEIQNSLRAYCVSINDNCKNCLLYQTLRYDESCPIDKAIDKIEKLNTINERQVHVDER